MVQDERHAMVVDQVIMGMGFVMRLTLGIRRKQADREHFTQREGWLLPFDTLLFSGIYRRPDKLNLCRLSF